MPLFASFSASSSRSLGLTSGAPPGPPTIDSSSSTATTYTINFTPVLGSFDIARFEYSLSGAAFTGSISGSATTHTITGLTPSTAYTLQIRAVDSAGQISDGSNVDSRSTSAEIPPSAPSVTVTQLESTGTPINATRLNVSFTAAPAGTYSVAYHQYRVYRGATLVTDWTTTPVGAGVTFTLTGLTPASSHTVDVRGVATGNGTTFGSVGSGTASTDTEIVNSAPSVTVNSVTTANVTFTRGTSSGGTYGVSYYRYQIRNNAGTIVQGPHDLSNASSQFTVATGVGPDEFFYVDVWAISATSGAVGTTGSAYSRLNPSVPSTPTATWNGMSGSSYGTANLIISKPSYATRAFVQVNGGTTYEATDNGSNFTISIGGQAHNSSFTYRCYVQNRLGEASGSAYRYWDTPKKNQTYEAKPNGTSEFILAATNNAVAPCSPTSVVASFGYIPPSDDQVGYVRIDYVGIQLKTGGFSNTVTSYLYFSYPGGTVASSLEANTTSTYSLRYDYVGVGGSSLSGGSIALNFLWVNGNPTGSASRNNDGGFGCLPAGSNWFYAKEFYVQGVQTTAGNPY